MAIQSNFPAIRPTLDLNFASSRTVDPRITFTRASTATYFDEFGVMRTAPANSPRIDFDPVTGECKGLLIEEQRTNLLTYSEQFNNASWSKTRMTVTPDAAIAPDGTLSADKFNNNGVVDSRGLANQSFTATAASHTASVFMKAGEITSAELYIIDGSGVVASTNTIINLTTGELSGSGAPNATATPLLNGWWRVSSTGVLAAGACSLRILLPSDATAGTDGIYIWGAQLEVGSFPTSYIKTEASQVTRAADSAVMTGSNFSSWANSVGTILAKYKNAGWKHNNTPPTTQLDITKYIQDYNTPIVSDSIKRVMFYPRQLTDAQIAALKG